VVVELVEVEVGEGDEVVVVVEVVHLYGVDDGEIVE
jgi:hypothetical protein